MKIRTAGWITLFLFLLPVSICFSQANPQGSSLAQIAGTIAYIGDDFNVYTYTLALDQHNALTEDASRSRHYLYPTWSNDGRLAYFCCDIQVTRSPSVEIYVTRDSTSPGDRVYQARDEIMTYAYWSPVACAAGVNCRDLAVLIGGLTGAGFKVEVLRNSDEITSHQPVGTGSPFYMSWSPDGTQMFWQRNNRRMDVFSIDTLDIEQTLNQLPGGFAAPAWSPVDDRLLFGQLNRADLTTDLVTLQGDIVNTLVEGISGLVAFSWSPDGKYIAYRVVSREGYGSLVVIDASTGQEITFSSQESVIAFFWSPDSQSLAYITPAVRRAGAFDASYSYLPSQQDSTTLELTWSVLNISDGNSQRFATFNPTAEMIYLITYFDQFTQSHRLWSPDSKALVYSELGSDRVPSVSILDIASQNAVPFTVAKGVLGIWSYR